LSLDESDHTLQFPTGKECRKVNENLLDGFAAPKGIRYAVERERRVTRNVITHVVEFDVIVGRPFNHGEALHR
jgi:hypothetical protein